MQQSEKDIPIDIHLNKLLDWLISRRICNHNWQKNILNVRQNINNAIQNMPANEEISQLLAGTYINYYHCCKIVEILKETESSSKNIFGQYSSKRMKDWLEIMKLYEKDNLYLAEAAQLLVRIMRYELPSLKRQIKKCMQIQEECVKKAADCLKSANALQNDYTRECRVLGIEGKDLRKEFMTFLDEMPVALNDVASLAKTLSPSRKYYVMFLNFMLTREGDDRFLPLLNHIINKGNTTTFEWRTGHLPDVVEGITPVMPLDVDNGSASAETTEDQIDFGDNGLHSESGDDRSSISPNGDFVHVEQEECKADNGDEIDFGDSGDINWDITVEPIQASEVHVENIVKCEEGKVAQGTDALSVLENDATRKLFFNDLMELEAFLQQRINDLASGVENDVLYSSIIQSAPLELQLKSIENIKCMLSEVKNVTAQLMSPKLKRAYLIRKSPRLVDRTIEVLKGKLGSAERMIQRQQVINAKYQEAVEEQKALGPKMEKIIEKTKVLLSQIQDDISKRYKNRPVNIVGGLNALQHVY